MEKILKGNGEWILLVEDEAAIMRMGKSMLERLGYQVIGANSPMAALSIAKEYAGEIQLLLTDVVMPEMNGKELASQLQTLCPSLKTLYMSGYTSNVVAHRGILDEGAHFVQKLFSLRSLASGIRNVLR